MRSTLHAGFSDPDPHRATEVSIVVPVCNEAEAIRPMYQRLHTVLAASGLRYEVLFIGHGSTDQTARALSAVIGHDPFASARFLVRGTSKESALTEGLARAAGQAVIIMDADLRDPPECIPHMLTAWHAGAEVVRMRPRPYTKGTLLRRLGRRCVDHTLNAVGMAALPENRIDFMLFSRKAAEALSLVVERKRDMARLFDWMGLTQKTIDYERAPQTVVLSRSRIRNTVRSHTISL